MHRQSIADLRAQIRCKRSDSQRRLNAEKRQLMAARPRWQPTSRSIQNDRHTHKPCRERRKGCELGEWPVRWWEKDHGGRWNTHHSSPLQTPVTGAENVGRVGGAWPVADQHFKVPPAEEHENFKPTAIIGCLFQRV